MFRLDLCVGGNVYVLDASEHAKNNTLFAVLEHPSIREPVNTPTLAADQ